MKYDDEHLLQNSSGGGEVNRCLNENSIDYVLVTGAE